MASLIDQLFGRGGGQSSGPTTAQVAEQTGATESSPFLQYLQNNQEAAQQTASAMMGERPEADYTLPLATMGLGILGQQPGGAPLGTIARGAMGSVPYFQQEMSKQEDYDKEVRKLATQLGLKDFEFMSEMKQGGGLKSMGDYIIDTGVYAQATARGDGPEAAFNEAVVTKKGRSAEENAKAYARTLTKLEEMRHMPDVDPAVIDEKEAELRAMEWQLQPQESTPQPAMVGFMGPDGTFNYAQGTPEQLSGAIGTIHGQKRVEQMRAKQQATDSVLGFASRSLDIIDDMSTFAGGRTGEASRSLAGMTRAITESMSPTVRRQYEQEVGDDPMARLRELRDDPEAGNYLSPGVYETLSQVGQENAQLVSNLIGFAYASAKSSDEAGRVSDNDLAVNLSRLGYNADAWINDPESIKAGILDTTRKTVADYEGFLELSGPQGADMAEKDKLLNKRLQEYGFNWTGGPRGQLTWGDAPQEGGGRQPGAGGGQQTPPASGAGGQQQQQPDVTPQQAPGVQAQPIEYREDAPVYDVRSLTPDALKNLPDNALLKTPDGRYKRVR